MPDIPNTAGLTRRLAAHPGMRDLIVPCANALRGLQGRTGGIAHKKGTARRLIEDLTAPVVRLYDEFGTPHLADAARTDLEEWRDLGVDSPPPFSRVREAWRMPENGLPGFFYGPVRLPGTAKGQPACIEAFLAWRDEPMPGNAEDLAMCRLAIASDGFASGSAMLFRPALIGQHGGDLSRTGELCFANKLRPLLHTILLPLVHRLFGTADQFFGGAAWAVARLDAAACYAAASLAQRRRHDRAAKDSPADWSAAVLAPLATDCRAMLDCLAQRVPGDREAFEIILFDRLFRHCGRIDATGNAGCASGILLFEMLRAAGAISIRQNGYCMLASDLVTVGLRDIATQIDGAMERSHDNKAALALIRRYLPADDRASHGFTFPAAYRAAIGGAWPDSMLRFDKPDF